MFRLIFFGLLAVVAYFVLRRLFGPSDYKRCGKCDGKGYWVALGGRETCDVCRGAGKVPRDQNWTH